MSSFLRSILWFPTTILLILLSSNRTHAHESYYMLLFAYQHPTGKPHLCHTFATFVKVQWKDGKEENGVLHYHTISWLPANLKVRLRCLLPEKGKNLSLKETMNLASKLNATISFWGPLQIRKSLYDRSIRQVKRLESGKVKYKAVDPLFPTNRASNCVHAVSDLLFMWIPRPRGLPSAWGKAASYRVLCRFRFFYIDPDKRHDWVAEALDIFNYPLLQRYQYHERVSLIPSRE